MNKEMNGDELDAVTGALVGKMYLKGKAEVLGDVKTGAIIVPKKTMANSRLRGSYSTTMKAR